MAPRPKKRLDHVHDAIRLKHDSRHTEEAYVIWITRDMFFHDTRHPNIRPSAPTALRSMALCEALSALFTGVLLSYRIHLLCIEGIDSL
jgi:hypothetical protein